MIDTLTTQIGGDHYLKLPIQPWEVMRAWMTPEEYRGYQKGVILSYMGREHLKNGDEDILKAADHMQELVNFILEQKKEKEEKEREKKEKELEEEMRRKGTPIYPDEYVDDSLHDED